MVTHEERPEDGETAGRILVVDDDPVARALLETLLVSSGFDRPAMVGDPRGIEETLKDRGVELVLLDLNMPHVSGRQLLERLSHDHPAIPVIVITAEDSIETAVECMKLGAFDFMTKPIEPNRLTVAARNALEYGRLRREVSALSTGMAEHTLRRPEAFSRIITRDGRMHELFRYIEAIAESDQPVLITGESGTGKELIARAVHDVARSERPFVAVNVAGLDDTMFSDTLFGHVSGAYTGAAGEREGLAARAERGTLFLDEIGDLSTQSQTKLLRLVQEHEYYPLGADDPKRFRARVVAATNVSLEDRVAEGAFRKDLYYRLLAHRAHVPALRERRGDIRPLSEHFAAEAYGTDDSPELPRTIQSVLAGYSFPGNVRELSSIVFDVISRLRFGESEEAIVSELGRRFGGSPVSDVDTADRLIGCFGRFPKLSEVEAVLIEAALAECNGNQTEAASLVGLSQSTLSRKLRK